VRTNFPGTGSCRLALGLANEQGIEIHLNNRTADSCAQATQVAETIIHNLGY
jgi:hypothetical protein